MRHLLTAIGSLIVLSIATTAQKPASYSGAIEDSHCAQTGTHDAMMASNHTKSATDCAVACVKSGAVFVLCDPSMKVIYQLDDQKKAKHFAGLRVNVTGTLDRATMTIHVKGIDTAPSGNSGAGW